MVVKTTKGDLPVRYGWSALAKFGDLCGMNMDKVMAMDLAKMKMSDMLKFILVGFEDGARKEGVECQFKTVEDIGDLLDEDISVMGKVMEAFSDMAKSRIQKEEATTKKK